MQNKIRKEEINHLFSMIPLVKQGKKIRTSRSDIDINFWNPTIMDMRQILIFNKIQLAILHSYKHREVINLEVEELL
jgi:hypothetical protein